MTPFKSRFLRLLTIISICLAVSSCSTLAEKLGYQRIPNATQMQCDNSKILITNLHQAPSARSYQLPDGRLCPAQSSIINTEEATEASNENQ